MPAQVVSVESTELFVGTQSAPQQIIRVTVVDVPPGTPIRLIAPGVQSPSDLVTAGEMVEVPITTSLSVGAEVEVAVSIHGVEHGTTYPIFIAEPGWTMVMVSHFHYDPVWWNTQAAYTSEWGRLDFDGSPRDGRQEDGFALVHAHLDIAKRDPDYAFVLLSSTI